MRVRNALMIAAALAIGPALGLSAANAASTVAPNSGNSTARTPTYPTKHVVPGANHEPSGGAAAGTTGAAAGGNAGGAASGGAGASGSAGGAAGAGGAGGAGGGAGGGQ